MMKNRDEKYAAIIEKKKCISSEELCRNLPKYVELYVS